MGLYRQHRPREPLRSVGVRGCRLLPLECQQLSLFDRHPERLRLEQTVDGLRQRFGSKSVQRGLMLTDPALSAVDPADHVIHPVGYFR